MRHRCTRVARCIRAWHVRGMVPERARRLQFRARDSTVRKRRGPKLGAITASVLPRRQRERDDAEHVCSRAAP